MNECPLGPTGWHVRQGIGEWEDAQYFWLISAFLAEQTCLSPTESHLLSGFLHIPRLVLLPGLLVDTSEKEACHPMIHGIFE